MMAVRITLMLTASAALIAYFTFERAAAQGVLMGGIAGILGFWFMAVRLEKRLQRPQQNMKSAVLRWSALRLAFYALVLAKAYTLDPASLHGLVGAAVGLMAIRCTQVFLGFTGLDLGHGGGPNQEEQQQ